MIVLLMLVTELPLPLLPPPLGPSLSAVNELLFHAGKQCLSQSTQTFLLLMLLIFWQFTDNIGFVFRKFVFVAFLIMKRFFS